MDSSSANDIDRQGELRTKSYYPSHLKEMEIFGKVEVHISVLPACAN